MLVLTRKIHETICIGNDAEIQMKILEIRNNQVRVGIEAPKAIPIHRQEIVDAVTEKQRKHRPLPHRKNYKDEKPPLLFFPEYINGIPI